MLSLIAVVEGDAVTITTSDGKVTVPVEAVLEMADALAPKEEPWLRTDEVARMIGHSEPHARELMRRGRIPATKSGKLWLAKESDVREAMLRTDSRT